MRLGKGAQRGIDWRTRGFPEWARDPDAPQSRFTRLPAIALIPDEVTGIAIHEKVGPHAPRDAAAELVGPEMLDEDEALGAPDAFEGSSASVLKYGPSSSLGSRLASW
jgi:hypothetical protein